MDGMGGRGELWLLLMEISWTKWGWQFSQAAEECRRLPSGSLGSSDIVIHR